MRAPVVPLSGEHPFASAPNRTFLGLALPVLLSLIAEPLTGLADTAFVARLGATELAALGVSITLLSSLFWVFNFLGTGTQTTVSQALGRGDDRAARRVGTTAVGTALVLGVLVALVGWPWSRELASFMGARGEMVDDVVVYTTIRFLGAPAVLALLASFGALRGLQDMRTPLRIAVSLNVLNVILDGMLIFGFGPIAAFGLPGAAWATVVSQWCGALWAMRAASQALGGVDRVEPSHVWELFVVGRDLVVRTALLLLFLLLATRAATQIGAIEGAAQQAVRQMWVFSAFLLDAFAASAQSLVGYFVGAGNRAAARRVARVACCWALAAGLVLALVLWFGRGPVAWLVVPLAARDAFVAVWWISLVALPFNALAFVTDGIHWGAGDYRYLRNVMSAATALGLGGLLVGAPSGLDDFRWVWVVTDAWIVVRATCGFLRVWPGIGRAPLRSVPPD